MEVRRQLFGIVGRYETPLPPLVWNTYKNTISISTESVGTIGIDDGQDRYVIEGKRPNCFSVKAFMLTEQQRGRSIPPSTILNWKGLGLTYHKKHHQLVGGVLSTPRHDQPSLSPMNDKSPSLWTSHSFPLQLPFHNLDTSFHRCLCEHFRRERGTREGANQQNTGVWTT